MKRRKFLEILAGGAAALPFVSLGEEKQAMGIQELIPRGVHYDYPDSFRHEVWVQGDPPRPIKESGLVVWSLTAPEPFWLKIENKDDEINGYGYDDTWMWQGGSCAEIRHEGYCIPVTWWRVQAYRILSQSVVGVDRKKHAILRYHTDPSREIYKPRVRDIY